METLNLDPPKSNFFTNISCKLFGHKYRIVKRYKSNIKEFECTHCKKQYTLDGFGHYTPLTARLKKMNEAYENFYTRKLSRVS